MFYFSMTTLPENLDPWDPRSPKHDAFKARQFYCALDWFLAEERAGWLGTRHKRKTVDIARFKEFLDEQYKQYFPEDQ